MPANMDGSSLGGAGRAVAAQEQLAAVPGLPGHGRHLVRRERLRQVVEGADLHRLDDGRDGGETGDDDGYQVRVLAAQGLEQLHPAHFGHLEIGEHQIEGLAAEQVQGLRPAEDGPHLVTFAHQDLLAAPADRRLVVDHQHARRVGASHRRPSPDRHADGEGGALAACGVDADLSVVPLDDAVGDRESQPGAGLLGREERLEDPRAHFVRDARARVGDPQLHRLLRDVRRGGEAQFAALHHGLGGVEHDVQDDLAHLVGVGQDGGEVWVQLVHDLGVAEDRLVADQRQGVFHHLVQVQQRALRPGLTGKIEQPFHDLPAAQRFVDDGLDVFPPWVIVGEILEHQAAVGEHTRQRIVDFVGDARGQLADGHHLLGLDHLRLHALQFGGPLLDLPLELVGALAQRGVGELELGGHRVEAVREVAQFVVASAANRLGVVALGNALRGHRHAVNRLREPPGHPHGHEVHERHAAGRNAQEDQQAAPEAVGEGPLEHPDVQHPDGGAGDVADRGVGGQVPVLHHEGAAPPGLASGEDCVSHFSRRLRADRPRAVGQAHVGRDAHIVLEDGRRADRPAFVLLLLEDRAANLVDNLVVAGDQHAPVEDAQQTSARGRHRRGGTKHHAGSHLRGRRRPGAGRGRDRNGRLPREGGRFPLQHAGVDDLRAGSRLEVLQRQRHQAVVDAGSRRSRRVPRPVEDPSVGIRQRQHVEMLGTPDSIHLLGQAGGVAPRQRPIDHHPRRVDANGILEAIDRGLVDLLGRFQVRIHLGLGLGEDELADHPDADHGRHERRHEDGQREVADQPPLDRRPAKPRPEARRPPAPRTRGG